MNDFFRKMETLRQVQAACGYRPSWVYRQLKDDFELEIHHLEAIAHELNFKPGWVYHKWQELQEERAEAAQKQYTQDTHTEPVNTTPSSPAEQALDLFGLRVPFSLRDLKASYRQMALKTHPDAGGSPAKFQAVSDSYNLLQSLIAGDVR